MTSTLPASSRRDCDTRPTAALHQRLSGRSRPSRIDPSTITSPATRPRTQISPGARGTIGPTAAAQPRNHSPPNLTEVPVQISRLGIAAARSRKCTPARSCATTSRRTACARRTRWPFSEPTLRSDPASSPGVYATASARSDSAATNGKAPEHSRVPVRWRYCWTSLGSPGGRAPPSGWRHTVGT
jgi:hypothetical protein